MTAGRRDQLADQARQLASAGFSYATAGDFDGCVRHLARELDCMIRQAQAEALGSAAEDMHHDPDVLEVAAGLERAAVLEAVYVFINARAAALRVTTDSPAIRHDGPPDPSATA